MDSLIAAIRTLPSMERFGEVVAVQGMAAEIAGLGGALRVGTRLRIEGGLHGAVACEVAGFQDGRAICLPFESFDGVTMGARAWLRTAEPAVRPTPAWQGRVIDALARPIDGKGPLPTGPVPVPLRNRPPPAHTRDRVGERLDLGVRALNTFTTCCRGQRLGIFAGSGVGKSVLMSMLARNTACDVAVIGLVGERGREVQDFLAETLGPDGLARSVVIVATSDEAALMRREAACLTLSVAEYFRDQGAQVLCMMDSVTRFAMAQREIGLAAGEPPTAKGYTPTVFAELPRLLERAGPGAVRTDGARTGSVTGIFTVLVDGDDHNEPVADAVRGILDGHIVMERSIAERGRYPAINVLKSVSRTMPHCNTPEETRLVRSAKGLMARYEEMAELIRLGAYRKGTDEEVDKAITVYPALDGFLNQAMDDVADIDGGYAALAGILAEIGEPAS